MFIIYFPGFLYIDLPECRQKDLNIYFLLLDHLLPKAGVDRGIQFHLMNVLGAVHMSRASPANRADLSHENLYFSTT